jgi:regulator of protease activity HflC (stomatin/prohibitin superfamily)
MFMTIVLAVLVIATAAWIVFWRITPKTVMRGNEPRPEPNRRKLGALAIASVLAFITVITFVLSSFVVVSTRNVGIVTTFGKPVGTIPNGLHFTWPWQSVTEMDGSIQIDQHKDDDGGDGHGNSIVVRLGNNSNAWADTSVRWEIKLDAADDLFLQYKTFDNVRANLITRNLQVALNEVFATYNPLGSIAAGTPAPAAPTTSESQLPALAKRATEIMQAKVEDQVRVFEVQIPTIAFDGETQAKIDQLNQQRAATAVAIESQRTASEQAKANDNIAASLQDPNVLVSKCLDVVKEKGGSPLGCWPNSTSAPVLTVPKP